MSRYADTPLEEANTVIEMAVHRATSLVDFEVMSERLDASQDSVTALLATLMSTLNSAEVEAIWIIATHIAQRAALTQHIRELPVGELRGK